MFCLSVSLGVEIRLSNCSAGADETTVLLTGWVRSGVAN